ncbi:methylated-DNA--protein-cysteine methyltransferase, inducible [Paenibacillus sp. J31TS4]|uniref:methylated-DNA--[protein]-cysteine S-methyltransferase n=1 Tax=Paenibacillus sp. J31TS4 TaxID=2807195 RepID=UPI001B25B528|nr:methylated-DNA--[protein]-cysteine S-methyltransferase [Paenibacillus sp. J31TS4]GIP38536.1 methylated-DNA--protein-cysteine methyltransferase, inducible [Paenibacillus sp. J31TS4]
MTTQTKAKPPLYWSIWTYDGWPLHLAATDQGLCYVGSPNRPFEELAAWAGSRFPGSELIRDEEKLRPYEQELAEYGQGKRDAFTIPVDLRGTAFQQAVWQALLAVPYGETVSYSDIAERIQRPSSVRAVGAAIGANPVLISVPCHRVIGKNGALTGYRGGMEMKTRLLRLEQEQGDEERGPRHG